MSKTDAFASFGTICKNVRWSWSGRSPDGKTVALTFWKDRFTDFKARPIIYDDTGWDKPELVTSSPGNRERIENIRWALDHLNGEVRVVIATAKDVNVSPREIKDCYPQPNLRMRITDFIEATGEWRAESIEG